MVQIREATVDDSEAVAELIHSAWPQEYSSSLRINQIQKRFEHTLLVAVLDDRVAGFASGFATRAQNGTLRWELDLLVVDSRVRGKGTGKKLIRECGRVARQHDVSTIRTLVRADNKPMMAACQVCGYQQEPVRRQLMIGMPSVEETGLPAPAGVYLVEVHTLTYSGLWIEGEFKDGCFQYARQALGKRSLDAAGALVPTTELRDIQMAASAGYTAVADYYFWTYTLK